MLYADEEGYVVLDTFCYSRSLRDVEQEITNGFKVVPDFSLSTLYHSLQDESIEFNGFNAWLVEG